MYIDYDTTYNKILTEDNVNAIINELPKLDSTKDVASIDNKFTVKPKGIIITDSYNNPFLPIRPQPRIDTSKMNLFEVFRRYRELYSQFGVNLLPWHYVIEFIEYRYFIFNTRPIDMKFPLDNNTVKDQRQDLWDNNVKSFITNNLFDISEMINILIIGDSNTDVYTKKFYELLGRICVAPFIRFFKLPEGIDQRTFFLNIGQKLNPNLITKFIRR